MTSVVKVIELIAESNEGWEAAAQDAVRHASMTIRNLKSVYIKDMQGIIENDRIVRYRVNAKITFVIDEGDKHE